MLALEQESSNSDSQDVPEIDVDRSDEYFAALEESALLAVFSTDRKLGLTQKLISEKLEQFGKNELRQEKKQSALGIFLHQFQSSVVYLLLAAALASLLYHEFLQAIGIMLAVFINAITGFYMEYKAGVSLEGLKGLAGQTIRCVREGVQSDLPVVELVPGDLVILEPGSRVPADIRLLEAANLSIDESPLTGESVPVFKDASVSDGDEPHNIAYHGTLVAGGRGLGLVLRTGMKTSLGRLGKLLESTESGGTPLERQLEKLGQQLSILTIIICSVVTLVGIVQKQDLLLMVETGIALAVAAIPEGLPVLATLALAMGIQRMVRNHAIVRHLAAMETLGCTSIICTDKTGTLTENLMTVCKIYFDGKTVDVEAIGYQPEGRILFGEKQLSASSEATLAELVKAGFLCNDAKLEHNAEEGWHVHGDPTEGALLALAAKTDLDLSQLKLLARSGEIPFDLSRKRMSTIHQLDNDAAIVYTKGAPGPLIAQCSFIQTSDGVEVLADDHRAQLMLVNEGLAKKGLRVLAFARKDLDGLPDLILADELESNMIFLGLIALHDAPRSGVKDAVSKCKNAGIKVVMLTGDQAQTARAVAHELGIISDTTETVVTGTELNSMGADEVKSALQQTHVLARVTPELKLSIVKCFQDKGSVVSMTGDGVNDAPALKQANIGVAMGLKGTDLARSVSQMVIADDNFCTIVKAIEQGRVIYGNIQRAVGYLLTASLASVLTVALGILCKVGLPLSPLQLLWLNLIMHIFPGLGIVMEKPSADVMNSPPRDPSAKLMGPTELKQIFVRSLIVSITVLASVLHAEKISQDASHTTTIGLATLSLCLLFQAWAWLGVGHKKLETKNFAVGPSMVWNMCAAYFMFFAAIYMPGLKDVLGTMSLGIHELLFCVGLAFVSLLVSTGVCAIAIKK